MGIYPENAALLAQKKQSALDEIEAADSTGLPAALFTAGKAALEQVDPIPKTVTVTSWPAASLVRGQALSQASLNGGKADVPGRFVWKEPDTRPQAGRQLSGGVCAGGQPPLHQRGGPGGPDGERAGPGPHRRPGDPHPDPGARGDTLDRVFKAPAAVRPTATPSATASATPSPKPTATVTPAPTAAATPAPTAEAPAQSGPESGSGMGPVWLLAGGAAALLVLAAVLVLRARRGNNPASRTIKKKQSSM